MNKSSVVILGGGVGGIVTANHLAKLLPPESEIVLIEKSRLHSFAASYLWLMVNKRTPKQISTPLRKLVNKRVKILFEEIKQIDAENKVIITENSQVSFQYLVIALGADFDQAHFNKQQFGIHNFFTLDGATNLNEALHNFKGGNVSVVVSALPYKCPGAPHEGAMLIRDFLNHKKLEHPANVNLYTPESLPLPVAGPELGNSVKMILEKKAIGFYPNNQLISVDSDEKKIVFSSGLTVKYDLLVLIPLHKAPEVISRSGLADESGWIPVNKDTLKTKYENVFAIGDITTIQLPGRWNPDKPMKLPKAGVFAHSQALVVSEIISSKIIGKESKTTFCGDGFCMLEAGEDLAGFAYGDFFASPHPDVKMKNVGKKWHLGKVIFEKWWLAPIGFTKELYKQLMTIGAKLFGVQIKL
ncbi:MAG: FAD/NAD(P)-binding oxidoreductase [Ignavibacteria bacterium]|nr:FAD/NAD(P)-binding oxidoreductase [Ignavibacteria bacterium]